MTDRIKLYGVFNNRKELIENASGRKAIFTDAGPAKTIITKRENFVKKEAAQYKSNRLRADIATSYDEEIYDNWIENNKYILGEIEGVIKYVE